MECSLRNPINQIVHRARLAFEKEDRVIARDATDGIAHFIEWKIANGIPNPPQSIRNQCLEASRSLHIIALNIPEGDMQMLHKQFADIIVGLAKDVLLPWWLHVQLNVNSSERN